MNNSKNRKKRDRVPNIRSLDEMAESRRWAKKQKWNYTLSTWLVGPICCIFLGYVLIMGHFVNVDSMRRVAGAVTINGTYESIRYVYIRSASHYEIKLCGSDELYIIDHVTFKGFDEQLFNEKMQPGMPVALTVSLKNTPDESTPVYAVSAGDISFLSLEDTIRLDEENNRYVLPIGASLMIIGSVSALTVSVVMYLRLRRIRKS